MLTDYFAESHGRAHVRLGGTGGVSPVPMEPGDVAPTRKHSSPPFSIAPPPLTPQTIITAAMQQPETV